MPFETFTVGYKMLFKVEVLHRYALNWGTKAFDDAALPPADRRVLDTIRRQYDAGRFWQITPDAATRSALQGLHMVFKTLSDGFCVGVETDAAGAPFIALPADLHLLFEVRLVDPVFLTYTDIDKSVCDDLMKNGKVFRFQNSGSGAQTLNTGETIGAADLEDYAPPPGGVQKRPLGYLDIWHLPPSPSLLDGGGSVPASQVFQILLANRSTLWQSGGAAQGQHPLVANGLIALMDSGGKKLPNPTPATTFYQNNQFISIIY